MKTLQSYMVNESSDILDIVVNIVNYCEELRGTDADTGRGVIKLIPEVELNRTEKIVVTEIHGDSALMVNMKTNAKFLAPLNIYGEIPLMKIMITLKKMVKEYQK